MGLCGNFASVYVCVLCIFRDEEVYAFYVFSEMKRCKNYSVYLLTANMKLLYPSSGSSDREVLSRDRDSIDMTMRLSYFYAVLLL